jgi:hypothetical protein
MSYNKTVNDFKFRYLGEYSHNIWNCVKKKRKSDMQKAEVKVKLVTDTYMLQYHQDKSSWKVISCIMIHRNHKHMKMYKL